jgi:hypothetical protein
MPIPYRIDLAGGWLDQPFVNKYASGSVVVVSIEPTQEYNGRGGMATSTRRAAMELWGEELPLLDYEKTAKMLFAWENPPGKKEVSGSQDAIGIVYPGCSELIYYEGYWPEIINNISDEKILAWLEKLIWMIPMDIRPDNYRVLEDTSIAREGAMRLAEASERAAIAIMNRDLENLKHSVTSSFEAQVAMFPRMINKTITENIYKYADQGGVKISGAGGGGYIIVISEDKPDDNALSVKIRREDKL